MGFSLGKVLKPVGAFMANPMVAGAATGVVADLYSARQARDAQREANETNMTMNRDQMAFQQYNSDTAHQREVADLEKAGLNPVLSANSGASTPVGGSRSVDPLPPSVPSGIAHSAVDMVNTLQGVNESRSRTNVNNLTAVNESLKAKVNAWDAYVAEQKLHSAKGAIGKLDASRAYMKRFYNALGRLSLNGVDRVQKSFDDVTGPFVNSARDFIRKRYGVTKPNTFRAE